MDEKLTQTVESPSTVADTVDTSAEHVRSEANEAGTSAAAVNPESSSTTESHTSESSHSETNNESLGSSVDSAASSEAVASPQEAAQSEPSTAEVTEPVGEQATGEQATGEAGSLENAFASAMQDETPSVSPEVEQDASEQDTGASAVSADEPTESPETSAEPLQVMEALQAQETSQNTSTEISDEVANQMTMEDVMAASDERLANPPVHRGMMVVGTIIMVSQEGVVVDIGQKIEGVIPFSQLSEQEISYEDVMQIEALQSGKEIQAYVIRADIPNNSIILSKKRADQERAWNLLQDIYDKKLPVEVEIIERVKGGLVAMLGVRAFLPASQVDIRRVTDLTPYVGQRLKVRIIELNRKRNRVIISRREILEEEVSELKAETLKKLEPGAQIDGEVVEITDFGVFVNLGGVDGLVHRSEITHGRFNHPREVLKVGEKVKVEVLDMDLEKERINLSRKSLLNDPWQSVLDNYSIGQRVSGKVTNLTQFGAFVEIEPGLEGLVHISEMSWTKRVRHPKEVVAEGDDVEAMVLKIDVDNQRVSLGMRQTQPDPWSSLPDNYPPGTEVSGPITGITDFGVFIEIEEGIEGLIHISELDNKRIDDINEHFKKGDVLEAVILNIDPVEQRASLSRKRTLPFEADDYGDDGQQQSQQRGGDNRGRKGGRRGGRRGQSIDYDYSYVAAESSSRSTTKLGDVYADLFAQFGLADSNAGAASDSDDATDVADAGAAPESATDVQASTETELGGDAASVKGDNASLEAETAPEAPEASETSQEVTPEAEQEAASTPATGAPDAPAEENEVAPEDAIDAAEAAALLTAAFRGGKLPEGEANNDANSEPTASE